MKKLLSLLLVFGTIHLFTSCNPQNKGVKVSDDGRYMFDINPNYSQQIKLSDYFKNVSYIALESSEESVFGTASKIKFYDDKIFILDRSNARALFVFEEDGKFLFKIGKEGHGPGEFSNLWDFSINPVSNKVLILDIATNQVKTFDMTGNFVKEKKLPSDAFYIDHLSNGTLLAFNHFDETRDSYNLVFLDDQLNITREVFKNNLTNSLENMIYPRNIFFENGDKSFFIHPYTYRVYRIKDDQMFQDFVFKFNDKDQPEGIIDNDSLVNLSGLKQSENLVRSLGDFYTIDSTVFFSYIYNGDIKLGLADLKQDNVLTTSFVLDDLSKYFGFNGFIASKSSTELVSYVDIPNILDVKALVEQKTIDVPNDISRVIKNTNATSNIVLSIYKN